MHERVMGRDKVLRQAVGTLVLLRAMGCSLCWLSRSRQKGDSSLNSRLPDSKEGSFRTLVTRSIRIGWLGELDIDVQSRTGR